MPRYPVLQPDGQLAIFSTIVDAFTVFNRTESQAVQQMRRWYNNPELTEHVASVASGEIPIDFWKNWIEACAWMIFVNGDSSNEDSSVFIAKSITPDSTWSEIMAIVDGWRKEDDAG